MRTKTIGSLALAVGAWLAPTTAYAHGGHPWLVGAAQPLLSLDHFLAGLFVAVVVSVGLTAALRRRAGMESDSRR
jgi:hydrogenase/urease accessory protein HupE